LHGEGIDVLTLCPGATESEATAKYAEQYGMVDKLQPAADVVRLALDNIAEGPTYIPHPHYRGVFDKLLAAPRRDALLGMAASMKSSVA
jgi:short-subunit dehydrogenase